MNSARLTAVKAALVQLASTDHRVMRAKVKSTFLYKVVEHLKTGNVLK